MSFKSSVRKVTTSGLVRAREAFGAGNLPNMYIIGAQKAGTTSLFHYLAQISTMKGSLTKEVHYYDLNTDKSLAWYRAHFSGRSDVIRFEATPYYLFHPRVPQRIKLITPHAKFVVLLRDPVKRAVSHHHHETVKGRETLTFANAIEAEPERLAAGDWKNHQHYSYVSRGKYAEQISRWFAHFDRSQFLFLEAEDMFLNPEKITQEVTEFLGVHFSGVKKVTPKNQRSYKQAPPEHVEVVRELLRVDAEGLPELIGFTPKWYSSIVR